MFGQTGLINADCRNYRVALYSHDTMGLGHIRRNLLIAQSLVNSPLKVNVLMIAGANAANGFAMPAGIDCLTLPALYKINNGKYKPRTLDVGLKDIITLRKNTILTALETFEPDILIVDKVPRGVENELDLILNFLRTAGKTRFVLGLRDILDNPENVRREWEKAGNEEIIRKFYDEIWVYGDPMVHNLAETHNFSPDIAAKMRYTGYFDQRKKTEWSSEQGDGSLFSPESFDGKRLVLCLVGGGQDGRQIAEVFARARFPENYQGVMLTGPFVPPGVFRKLQKAAAKNPQLQVIKYLSEPTRLLEIADRVVAMGGYNTVNEILSFGKPALIVPRARPREEQLIRAEHFHKLGLLDFIKPDEITPEKLTDWLENTPSFAPTVRDLIDLDGLERIPHFTERLVADRTNCPPLIYNNIFKKEIRYAA